MSAPALRLRTCLGVYGALVALTALTVLVAFADLGTLNLPIALGIASAKAALVAAHFMEVRRGHGLAGVYAAAGLLWLSFLMGLTLADFLLRAP